MTERAVPTTIPEQQRNWGALAHLSAFAGFAVPMGNVLGPLVVWLIKKDESPFIADHARQAVNFQILATLLMFAATVMSIFIIGIPFLIVLIALGIVFTVQGTIAAGKGEPFDYPINVDFVR